MRVGEAIAFDRGDVDLDRGAAHVRHGKFGKTRQLALHPSTVAALRALPAATDRLAPTTGTSALLCLHWPEPAALLQRSSRFHRLVRRAGLAPRSASCRPRIHDLRHSFAVRSMLDAYAAGEDGQARLTLLSTWLGHVHPAQHLLVPVRFARVDGGGRDSGSSTPGRPIGGAAMSALAPTLQAFFTDRLIRQRHASAHTIAAYRDTCGCCSPSPRADRYRTGRLEMADLDAPLIAAFLEHLEHERGNSVRTRNARLAAIHSLFRFAALAHPEHAETIDRVLAIPPKRFDRALITYLTEPRSTRCWRPATAPPGPGAATMPYCCSPCRPGCGSPNSPR